MGALSAGLITELAFAASDWSSVETQVLTLFEQHIGGDTLFFADERGPSDATRGVLVDYLAEVRPLWPSFSLELYPMAMAAQQRGGVLVDSDVFGTTMRAMAHYQQVMAPVRGRTTLIVAHRLSTIEHADRVVVIEGGRVAEQGPHAALIAQGGLYARLHAMQFKT